MRNVPKPNTLSPSLSSGKVCVERIDVCCAFRDADIGYTFYRFLGTALTIALSLSVGLFLCFPITSCNLLLDDDLAGPVPSSDSSELRGSTTLDSGTQPRSDVGTGADQQDTHAEGALDTGSFADGNTDGEVLNELCSDGVDNDGDGLRDCYDEDCATAPSCATASAEDCFNGSDDDGDALVDCDDADCVDLCGNGGDDPLCMIICMMDPSGMGMCDCSDFEDCTNGTDDDGDGAIDCDDEVCANDPACG